MEHYGWQLPAGSRVDQQRSGEGKISLVEIREEEKRKPEAELEGEGRIPMRQEVVDVVEVERRATEMKPYLKRWKTLTRWTKQEPKTHT